MLDIQIETAVLTDRGRLRPGNEDAVDVLTGASPLPAVLIVADGVGGLKEGAFASLAAVRSVRGAFASQDGGLVERLSAALSGVNRALYDRAGGDETRLSGSTVVALALESRGATVLHAGDSRAYLLRGPHLVQVTRDHTWVNEQVEAGLMSEAEAVGSSKRNIITRCLGVEPDVQLDVRELGTLQPGDTYLLSSDGLHGVVSAAEIVRLLAVSSPLEHVATALVNAANAAGGPDNISVALARIVPG